MNIGKTDTSNIKSTTKRENKGENEFKQIKLNILEITETKKRKTV